MVFERRSEIHIHALCMPDVQIPVRFGRKTRLDRRHLSVFHVFVDKLLNKIGCLGNILVRFFHIKLQNCFKNAIRTSFFIQNP